LATGSAARERQQVPPAPQRGFTLIELMVAVSLVAVLAAIAAANLSSFFVRNRVAGASNDLFTALSLARGEATMRGMPVTLRRLSSTSRDWSGGWELFVDINGDGLRDTSAGSQEVLLRQAQPLAAPLTLQSSLAAADTIQFLPNGRVLPSAAGPALFMLCHDNLIVEDTQPRSRAIAISDSGRIRVAAFNSSGYPLNDLGNAVTSCSDPS
jgi:type IV fimbrial biogenesis protein FimT